VDGAITHNEVDLISKNIMNLVKKVAAQSTTDKE
jgi:hypothetical protein